MNARSKNGIANFLSVLADVHRHERHSKCFLIILDGTKSRLAIACDLIALPSTSGFYGSYYPKVLSHAVQASQQYCARQAVQASGRRRGSLCMMAHATQYDQCFSVGRVATSIPALITESMSATSKLKISELVSVALLSGMYMIVATRGLWHPKKAACKAPFSAVNVRLLGTRGIRRNPSLLAVM